MIRGVCKSVDTQHEYSWVSRSVIAEAWNRFMNANQMNQPIALCSYWKYDSRCWGSAWALCHEHMHTLKIMHSMTGFSGSINGASWKLFYIQYTEIHSHRLCSHCSSVADGGRGQYGSETAATYQVIFTSLA